MFSMLCCPVLVLPSAFVTLSFHEIPNILLCHLWCAGSAASCVGLAYRPTVALFRVVEVAIEVAVAY